MREETILNYQNLVYKILSHYRNLYNYNRDFEEDYFHDGMVALIQAYDTYKDDNNDKFIICSLYGIKTKRITQKNLAKILNYTQSCIAKKHNKILNLIKESLRY